MKKILLLVLLTNLFIQIKVNSQSITLSKQGTNNFNSSNYFTVPKNSTIDSFIIKNRNYFLLGTYDNAILYESTTDAYGWKHRKYHIYHKGIKVFGQNIIIQENTNNEIIYIGKFANNIDIDTFNKISNSNAIGIAYNDFNSKYSIPMTSCSINSQLAILNTKQDRDNRAAYLKLVYFIEIGSIDGTKPAKKYFINAVDGGNILNYEDKCMGIQNVSTIHYGNRPIETQGRTSTHNIQNVCTNPLYNTFQINYTTSNFFNIDTVSNPNILGVTNGFNNTTTFGEATTLKADPLMNSIQRALNEAQYLTNMTSNMFNNRFGASNYLKDLELVKMCLVNGLEVYVPLNKKGFTIGVRAVDNPFNTYVSNNNYLNIGRLATWVDTNKWNFNLDNNFLVGADIVSHEITHTINSRYANFNPWLESGALSESFCDIFGYYFETWMFNNGTITKTPNWSIGDEINLSSYNQLFLQNNNPLAINARSMSNPQIYRDPIKFKGTDFKYQKCCTPSGDNDMCWIHSHNSIQNRWFFLCNSGMANFGQPIIPLELLINVVFDNLRFNLTNNANFIQARRGSLISLAKIYGTHPQYNQMRSTMMAAWDSVNVVDTLNNTFVLASMPGNNIINGLNRTFYVYHDIIIPSLHHVQFKDITLLFDEGVGIKTQIGGCLSSRKATFTSIHDDTNCESVIPPYIWAGIDIEGYSDGYDNYNLCENSYLANSFISNNPVQLGLDLQETTISYAKIAVKSGTFWYPDDAIPFDYNAYYGSKKQTGCDVNIDACNFINNKKDIYYVLDNYKPTFMKVRSTKFSNEEKYSNNLQGRRIEIFNDNKHTNIKGIKDYLYSNNNNFADIGLNDKARINFINDTFTFPTYDDDVFLNENSNTVIYCNLNNYKNRVFDQYKTLNFLGCKFNGSHKGVEVKSIVGMVMKHCSFDSVDYPIIATDYKNFSISNINFYHSYIGLKLSNSNSINYLASKSDSSFYYTNISLTQYAQPVYRAIEAYGIRNLKISESLFTNNFAKLPYYMYRCYQSNILPFAPITNLKEFIGINLAHCYKSIIEKNTFQNIGTNQYFYFKYNDITSSFDTIPLLYEAITITNNSKSKDYIFKNLFQNGWDVGLYAYGQNTGLVTKCNTFGNSNIPFELSAIYVKDDLRWQGCSDAFIKDPINIPSPCNSVNDPAANTFSWSNCGFPDNAKITLDSNSYSKDFRYYTQSIDDNSNPLPFVNNSLTSFCFNTPLAYPKNNLTNCGGAAYKIKQTTCSDSIIMSTIIKPFNTGNGSDRLIPICDFEPVLASKSTINSNLISVRANSNFDVGIENISKSSVLLNLRNLLAEVEYEIIDMSERCRDTIKFNSVWETTSSFNIQLMKVEDKIAKKQYGAASDFVQSFKTSISNDNDYPASIKQAYTTELDKFTPLINALSENGNSDSLTASVQSQLKTISAENSNKAAFMANQILSEKCNGVFALNVPPISIAANNNRWKYLSNAMMDVNPYQFFIFPNPVADNLEYRCELLPEITNAKITLFKISNPTTYLVNNTFSERGSIMENLNVSNYSAGLYMITLWVNNVPSQSYIVQKE